MDKELYDVVIVGAGLAGIGTAYWIQDQCPDKRYMIIEGREAIGGTWDLFRYPGIRSDSDMFTFGYAFKPWNQPQALADGPSILQYLNETIEENGIDKHILFGHKVIGAEWSSTEACWTLQLVSSAEGRTKQVHTRFLCMCTGYYDYEQAHRPQFAGEEEFSGQIILPQFWPQDLDYSGKRVVVVGSGATAVTLVPTMAGTAAHVTMLQRSPTYIIPLPNKDKLYKQLKKWLPKQWAYNITRWKNLLVNMGIYKASRVFPAATKRFFMNIAAKYLGPDYEIDRHFNPSYNPWDQRLCVVPDGDLFQVIRKGEASVVTDRIDRFTEKGILLRSGEELNADIIVLATGLKIKIFGGAKLRVDGKAVQTNEVMVYKGMMMSDIPNFTIAFGYTNAPWTLKTDLTASYVCRLLRYMDRHGHDIVVPRIESDVEPEPFVDFDAGYIKRANHILPKQGSRKPWRVYQNYLQDMLTIRYGRIADRALQFGQKGKLP